MPAEVKRAVRVAARIKEELAQLLVTEVRDPRLTGILVSRVEMPDDLRGARVYVRLLEGGGDAARRKEALTGLERAAGMLRREVGNRVGLRFAPELRFYYDVSQEKVDRIEILLDEVRREKKP
jgi:ribosome-binding factor A